MNNLENGLSTMSRVLGAFDLTLVIALITAIAAILAPLISSIISQRGSYKIRLVEMFYRSKVDAYTNFIYATSKVNTHSTADELMEMQRTLAEAMLFSSNKTHRMISNYSVALIKYRQAKMNDLDCSEYLKRLGETQRSAITAMRAELTKYEN